MEARKNWQRMTKSPTIRLLIGLLITLLTVAGFSAYSLHELAKLRLLQNQTIDLNRHDSLVLLRIQNIVNTLGLKLQDISERAKGPAILEYSGDFASAKQELAAAIRVDEQFAPDVRNTAPREGLVKSVGDFWLLIDRMFTFARAGRQAEARRLASGPLSDEQIVLERQISKLLAANNEAEERADTKIASIYDGSERDIYVFVFAAMLAIVLTSGYLIYSNRRLFDRLELLSRQRRVLAARLISVQEEVLRSVSRELHDEFGQILTAVGAMLARAERKGLPPDSPFRTELSEVREITHSTLEKMRSLSQMLHPAILDDYGLAKGVEWYAEVFERQTGVHTAVRISGEPKLITGACATHCFRILQESLTNVAKHSGSKAAEVELLFERDELILTIRDFGSGLPASKKRQRPGLGLIAMHERAELINGELKITSRPNDGTTVWLKVPLTQEQNSEGENLDSSEINEVLFRES
jgi:signal transduction histidine kinase